MRKLFLAGLSVALLIGGAVVAAGLPGPVRAASAAAPVPGHRTATTLITGDQVLTTGHGQDLKLVGVRPAPGRERMGYLTAKSGGAVFVYPQDAVPLVRSGQLDKRLFDVAGLVALGYDDTRRPELPLIVKGVDGPALAGAESVRDLPATGMTAVRQPRATAAAFWRSVTGGTTRLAAEHIWLDGVARVHLDQSVRQVGAPTAWQHGHTGQGVRVAVLDTGYDRAHPDLAGKVLAEQDFTGNPAGVHDGNGHGTHVAATVAGTGAASGGRYRGVAPDAQLLVGKVCLDDGSCEDSAILDGMAWAAEQGATVVNLSLGGGPDDGTHPLAQAVNELTARFGTLFVAAAGNTGAEETVGAPASADAALAVASVTKQDTVSGFSSRGPRAGDRAVKPDIAAPGSEIVAARSAGTAPDAAVDVHYARLSGTSMASPHVAGAAAIVAGSHPDLTPGQLKAVLMGTADPVGDAGVYAIGAGRLDVAGADATTVWADQGSLSLGIEPAQRITYHNDGTQPVTLTLTAELTDRLGGKAPAGLVAVAPDSVVVPAKGSATATVTADPGTARAGLFGGRLTATASRDTVLTTGIGVEVKAAPRTLTITAKAAAGVFAMAQNEDTGEIMPPMFLDGSGQVSLPAGRYRMLGNVYDGTFPDVTSQTMFADRLDLTGGDVELVLDATKAKPVKRGVDDERMRPNLGLLSLDLTAIGMWVFGMWDTYLLPSKKIDGLRLQDTMFWQEPLISATATGMTSTEVRVYDPGPIDFLGEAHGPLIDVGAGTPAELAGKPLAGAIALFTPPAGVPPDELAARLTALHKAGVVLVLHGDAQEPLDRPPGAEWPPVVTADRDELAELLAAGPVTMRVHAIENTATGYLVQHQVTGRLPHGVNWVDRRADLATVETTMHDTVAGTNRVPLDAELPGWYGYGNIWVRPPGKLTVHVTPGVPISFGMMAELTSTDRAVGMQFTAPRAYSRGERVALSWLRAPFGPALRTPAGPSPWAYPHRQQGRHHVADVHQQSWCRGVQLVRSDDRHRQHRPFPRRQGSRPQ